MIKALPQLKAEEGELLVSDGQAYLHGVGSVEPGDLASAAHKLPHINIFLAHDPIEGSPQHGAL